MSHDEIMNDLQYPRPGKRRDMVEVVRCKDCKHNRQSRESGNANCELYYGMTDQMGFCHVGERRDG